MKLLVVVLNYGVTDLTIRCLRALAPEVSGSPGIRVGVCENGTGPEAAQQLREAIEQEGWGAWAYLRELYPNRGFTGGNNVLIREALAWPDPPEYFLLLNADAFVEPGALGELIRFMEAQPKAGVAGSRIENMDGTWQCSPFRYPTAISEFDRGLRVGPVARLLARWDVMPEPPSEPARAEWLSGASIMVRRQVFEQIGLLDEDLYTYFDDVDLCLNARRAGWDVWYVPASRVKHLAGQSTGVSARTAKPKRRPAYWYLARRHFFLKNYGALRTLWADVGFVVGLAVRRAQIRLFGKADSDPPHMLWDSIRHSVVCTGFQMRPVPNPALQGVSATSVESRGDAAPHLSRKIPVES